MQFLDIKTGTSVTLLPDIILKIEPRIPEQDAISWTGLTPFLAWRVKQAQKVTANGQIVTVALTDVYLNLDERDGLENGDRLRVHREGQKLTDPETDGRLAVEDGAGDGLLYSMGRRELSETCFGLCALDVHLPGLPADSFLRQVLPLRAFWSRFFGV